MRSRDLLKQSDSFSYQKAGLDTGNLVRPITVFNIIKRQFNYNLLIRRNKITCKT